MSSPTASPKLSHAEGEAGNVWSKFLGKVPEYFTGSESSELDASNGAAASANGEAQNDEIANDGGSSYPNPSQIQWQNQFDKCMQSNYGQSSGSGSSGSGSSESSNQYGANQISGFTGSSDSFKEYMEKCRSQVSNSLGQYPGASNGQDFFNQYKPPQIPSNIGPSNFGSYTSALTGSSPSSGSSASA